MANFQVSSTATNNEDENFVELQIRGWSEGTFVAHHFYIEMTNTKPMGDDPKPCACPQTAILKNITKNITIELQTDILDFHYDRTDNWVGDTIRVEPKNLTCPTIFLAVNTEYQL